MKQSNIFLLSMLLILLLSFNNSILRAEKSVSADINIIDQPPQFQNAEPKIIAGLWHEITFNDLNNLDKELFLTVYKGITLPSEHDNTNYYQWKYLPAESNPWQSNIEYAEDTIDPLRCTSESNTISFYVGIPDHLPNEIFYNERWTIELSTSEKTLFTDTFYLEKPTRGFAKSHGDRLHFSVDPFTEKATKASDYLILKNTGNVPLNITIDFKALDDLLTYTESNDQIPAHNQQNYRLLLDAQSWKPQRIQQRGSAIAKVSDYYLLDEEVSGTAVSLQTALVIDVPTINIFVGHNNYELTTLDESTGLSFQYQKSVSMSEGETKTLNTYISGEGTATVSIQTNDNLSVIELKRNDQSAQNPFIISSTNAKEQMISLTVKALSENRDGRITYNIETSEGIKTFTTYVNVGPPTAPDQPAPIGATSPVTIIVLLVLIIAAGYMLYNHLIHGRSQRR